MAAIVLDAGHGGYDAGAVYYGRQEKDDNLRLTQAVRDRLVNMGHRVTMTRDSDVFIPLLDRSAVSNNINPDLFVSIHRNSVGGNPSANGVEIWVQNGSPAANTTYAQNVLNQIVGVGVQSDRGIKEGNFSVLRNTRAPAMLIEMGFISNQYDNTLFDQNFNQYADAIARGIHQSVNGGQAPQPGKQGDAVIRSLQSTLNNRYNAGLAVDGIYGINTKRAMIRALQSELNWQKGAGLVVDGILGRRTLQAIPNLREGVRGNMTYLLQAALYINGYPTALDGIYGPNTRQAVYEFQRRNGIAADGIAGPITFSQLFA